MEFFKPKNCFKYIGALIIFGLCCLTFSFVNATSVGVSELTKGRVVYVPSAPINYSDVNVNNSLYWNGNSWSDTRWLNIDGSNANQDINIGTYDFFADDFYGDYFNMAYLSSNFIGVIDMTGSPWYLSGTNFQVEKNITADYYFGDASYLSNTNMTFHHLSTLPTIVDNDEVLVYDASVGSNGRMLFEDFVDKIDHDKLTNWVANKHIDWTDATENFETSGTFGINTAGAANYRIKTSTEATYSQTGIYSYLTYDPSSSANANIIGHKANVRGAGSTSNNINQLIGHDSYIYTDFGTGYTGTIQRAIGFNTDLFFLGNGGTGPTIANAIGLNVESFFTPAGASITNAYGIRIMDVNAGTSNYAIYSGGGAVELTDGTLTTRGNIYSKYDNAKHYFGAGNDAYVKYDGSNLIFNTNVTGSGLAWFSKNISTTGVIVRTEIYNKSQGSALDKIKDADDLINRDGDINHSEFYGHVNYEVTDYSRPVEIIDEEEYCWTNPQTDREECEIRKEVRITHPYKMMEDGVNLGSEIELLRQALFELKIINEELENRVKILEKGTGN